MPYPDQGTEHLQSCIRRWLNREVRDYFRDLNIDDTWDPDLTIPRQTLAAACMHQDDDSLMLTQMRCWFFEYIKGQAYRVPFYGIPVSSFQEARRFRPQIKLVFREDLEDVEPGYTPVEGEITCRLMDHTSDSITPAIAQTFATRVKSSFGAGGNGLIWRKGRTMASYADWKRGYQLQLLVRSEADARLIVENVLDIQQHSPDWSKLNISENQEPASAYPTIPETEYIYGESRRLPRRRPVADCRFQYALLHVHGVQSPIVLYDRSYTYSTALIEAN
jgi:hypothetical protein